MRKVHEPAEHGMIRHIFLALREHRPFGLKLTSWQDEKNWQADIEFSGGVWKKFRSTNGLVAEVQLVH